MDPVHVTDLRCQRLVNPLGLGEPRPSLSWRLECEASDVRQTAYQVLVQSDGSTLWDSGEVPSGASVWVPYEGPALVSRQRVTWRVRVWTNSGPAEWSEEAFWEMGLLSPEDWTAQWIGGELSGGSRSYAPAPCLRSSFSIPSEVVSARLYTTALGLYDLSINDQRVGNQELAPGWTDYRKRVRYQVYDVTDLLQKGGNEIRALLGDGWYCGCVEWRGRELYGDRPKLLAQLELTLADGSRQVIKTDQSWEHAYGPILENDLLMGEAYDARKAFDTWHPVRVFDEQVNLVAMEGPPVRAIEEIVPIEVKEQPAWPASKWLFDMGQNMVGRIRLRVQGQPGQTLTLRYGEILDKNGRLYTENLRSARQTDYYTCRGDGEEVWEPKFTFHGFRYVEISGLKTAPDGTAVTGVVLHSDVAKTGDFVCSDPLINQLQKNIDWGQRGNFVDVPTDCPQRDERLGWTGDAQVFVRTAAYNREVDTFFRKYVQDLEDSQFENGAIPPFAPATQVLPHEGGPAWSDAFLICPWEIFNCYGDLGILVRHYPAFQEYFDFLEKTSKDNLRCWQDYEGFHGFGDWLSHEANTPLELLGTAFFAHAADLMARISSTLGFEKNAARYQARFDEIRKTFQDRYITPQGFVASGTQTAYVLALHFGLMPEKLRGVAIQELVDDIGRRNWRLSTGFVGTPYLCSVLTKGGRLDVAYKLLNQKAWPSWLYPVTKGATTIWERWDGWTEEKGFQDPGMNSFNHYAYGAIGDWMYTTVLGIEAVSPGYKKFRFQPRPGGGLTSASGHLDTVYGRIEASWSIESGKFRMELRVPPNTHCEMVLPDGDILLAESGRHELSEAYEAG